MRIEHSPRLSDLTTLRIGGRAIALVTLESRADLDDVPDTLKRLGGRIVIMGQGSNIMAHDGELAVTLVRPAFADEPQRAGTGPEGQVLVRVGAGVMLPVLLGWCAREGLGDLTGMTGIPGRIGGAVAMNAGSYGREMGHVLTSVEVCSPAFGLRTFTRSACQVAYRHFALPQAYEAQLARNDWWMITGVELALEAGREPVALRAAMADVMARKKSTQPVRAASAGCIFKNPPGLSAGKLLDEAGCRGRRVGGMALSAVHANFLVNEGGGTACDALELLDAAREAVQRVHGITLAYEVKELTC